MIPVAVVERARLYVRRWFARNMPPTRVFHDLEHTLAVTNAALALARSMGLSESECRTLEVAALFHDTGYARSPSDHERGSSELAGAFLTKAGISIAERRRIKRLILATKLSNTPKDVLEQTLRDADSSKAGQVDFIEKSELLRKELEAVSGKRIPAELWLQQNLEYLRQHKFYTVHAKRRYENQKKINLRNLEARAGTPKKERKPIPRPKYTYFDRDLSWLSFNDRVLQEAKDDRVPLLERIKFLAIYSSNLDEFYRVRVASLRSLVKLKKTDRTALEVPPEELVKFINRETLKQQKEFGTLFREELLPTLREHGVRILQDKDLDKAQRRFVDTYFKEHVTPLLNTASVRAGNAPFIEDRKLYFACRLRPKGRTKERLVLLNIPSDELGRFLPLPSKKGNVDLIFLDDVMRNSLRTLFSGYQVLESHAIKLSRDAELHLDEEFMGNVKDKVRKSLKKRTTGVPSRFLYDSAMPAHTLRALRTLLGLSKPDLVPGGRYHNFSDLMKLPVTGHPELREKNWPIVPCRPSDDGRRTFEVLREHDLLWHFPYNDFGNVVRWLQVAARDPKVSRIYITLYRVASGSAVCQALVEALERGKKVTVFVEVQARFDERSNLYWGEALEKAGANVLYSYEGLKVHCKLCLIERREQGRIKRYAYLGTGNFNERTSTIYSDMALLTAKPSITKEVASVFAHLADRKTRPVLSRLILAPTSMRGHLESLIDKEIEAALTGKPAEILLKLNSLEDHALIRKLYDASNAGVQIRLIIRGICCLVPGMPGSSANIQAISIVDRYLEHTRVYAFHNRGETTVLLSSADWMGRNLDRRIEVAFPIEDLGLKRTILELMEIQWKDHVKARMIDERQSNPYRSPRAKSDRTRAQRCTHEFLTQSAEARTTSGKAKRPLARK